MKICPNCAKQNRNDAKYCTNCGYSLEHVLAKEDPQPTRTAETLYAMPTRQIGAGVRAEIEERNIPVSIMLTIVTCGIYGLYWIAKINDEMDMLVDDESNISGALVVALSIVTCGIYMIYWNYKMGTKVDELKGTNASTGILYLVFSCLGLGIIVLAIIQDEINKVIR